MGPTRSPGHWSWDIRSASRGASISTDIGNGPGVQELVVFSVPVSGAGGAVAMAGGHGTVTGVAGGIQLRPFARLTWPDHASITTYGALWNAD
jgi:hypothetical protein